MDRLARKLETARTLIPAPRIESRGEKVGLIYFGSSSECVPEARFLMEQKGLRTDTLQLRALPLHKEVDNFLKDHERLYVIEQNRDAQLAGILRMEKPEAATKLFSVLEYDGLPLTARHVAGEILTKEGKA